MSYEDPTRLQQPREQASQPAQADHKSVVAPGKRTRTQSLSARRSAAASAAVQQKPDPMADVARQERMEMTARWIDTAIRPDLYPPPVQMHGGGGVPEGDVHELAAQGLSGSASALPHLDRIQRSFGQYDISGVQAHIGGPAAQASEDLGAEAYATGNQIAFRSQPDLHTAAHEAAHVVQQRAGVQLAGGVGQANDMYERHADTVADLVLRGQSAEQELSKHAPCGASAVPSNSVQATAVQMGPIKSGLNVANRLMKWLGRESVKKQISKHVAKHGRQIAGKAVHTIFKNPNKIRQLARKAGQEAVDLAAANSKKTADEVLSGPGIRMFRQAVGSGKYRWIIEKEFKNAIGTNGEKILKVVVDLSGRIVSAYPIGRFTALGLSVAAMEIFDAKTAEAGERIQDAVIADAAAREARDDSWDTFLLDLLLPIGFGVSSLNEGETLTLEIHRIESELYADLIAELESEEKRSLTSQEKGELYRLLTSSVGAAMVSMEEGEDDDGDVE